MVSQVSGSIPDKPRKMLPFEGDWRAMGMVCRPETNGYADLATASKAAIESLSAFRAVRDMLCTGASAVKVMWWLREEMNQGYEWSEQTMMQYLVNYRRYWIPPEMVLKSPRVPPNLKKKVEDFGFHPLVQQVMVVRKTIWEVDELRRAAETQAKRIQKMLQMEEQMSLPLPQIRSEYAELRTMLRTLQEMQSDLGVEEYRRASQAIDMTVRRGLPTVDWGALKEEDRAEVAAFMSELMEMLDAGPIPVEARDITPPKSLEEKDTEDEAVPFEIT